MTDRTTKTLLTFIAVALWGLLLRLCFAPTPSEAGRAVPQFVGLTSAWNPGHSNPQFYVLTTQGRVYSFTGEVGNGVKEYGRDWGRLPR